MAKQLHKGEIAALGSIIYPFIKKYPNQSLDEIAESDEGLKYLDWLIGTEWLREQSKLEIETYLKHFHRERWEALGD